MWRLYVDSVAGTKGASKFSLVTEDQDRWNDVIDLLEGTEPVQDTLCEASSFGYLNWWTVFSSITVVSLLFVLTATRGRCKIRGVCFVVLGVCGLLRRASTTFRVCAPRATLPLAPKNMPEPSSVEWIDEETSSAGLTASREENEELNKLLAALRTTVDEFKILQYKPAAAPPPDQKDAEQLNFDGSGTAASGSAMPLLAKAGPPLDSLP